jgi:ribosome-binding factor A
VVADALLKELRDPRLGFSTVTGAKITNDLAHATVFVTVMGDDEARATALEALNRAARFLRGRLGKVLGTRVVPELHFELDLSQEHARRIDEILSGLHRKESAD